MTHSSPSDAVLLQSTKGAVRILTMNRGSKHNALNTELTQSLLDALRAADRDDAVGALILDGAGPSFCAGADLSEFKDLTPENQRLVLDRADLTCALHRQIQNGRKPVIGVAHGNALGGGAGLAIACDLLVAAPDLRLGYPEMRHSIVPALVMTGLQRQFGRKAAFRMIALGEILSAGEARQAGVVNEVAADREAALALALDWAGRLARANPMAMAATKELFYRVADLPFEAAMQAGRDTNALMRGFRGGKA